MLDTAHRRWLAGAYALCAVVGWSGDALVGVEQAGALPVLLAVLVWRRAWHPREVREVRDRTAAALRRHRDPGEDLRTATVAHARATLRRPSWPASALAVTLLALAVGCAMVGWQRDDGWDAAPALPLLVVAVGAVVVDRRSRQRARRWVSDPPYAAHVDVRG